MFPTREELTQIDDIQKRQQEIFRSYPKTGTKVMALGKTFIVCKNVFWLPDTLPCLIDNYVINRGEDVLDVCTGSGIIAIFSAYKGAKSAVALDFNPDAVKNAKMNANFHEFQEIIDIRLSDMFSALRDDEKFDVITANIPFRNKKASDFIEASQWDTDLDAHRKFFAGAEKHLKPGGRIYFCQSNFGALKEMISMAKLNGFSVEFLGERKLSDPRIFYAFELRKMD